MDSILTVVREWQGVGRTEMGRGGNERGNKKNGKSNWQQSQSQAEITSPRAILSLAGNPGGQSSRQQPITAAAFSSQYLIPAGALQVTTPRRPLLALIWLNASLSGCKFAVEDAADLPLAPHTHTLSHATNQVQPTVSPWVAWIDGRFY